VNKEQSAKDSSSELSQAGINRAFSAKQRTFGFHFHHGQTTITLLNGKHSGRLGVMAITGSRGESLEVTDLERTLIDIAVRPAYAGGVRHVLTAYLLSRPRVSINRIATLLRRLDHVYPYRQAIGFYLASAGHTSTDLDVLRKPKLKFDFFLAHGMKHTRFDERWRIHFPADATNRVPPLSGLVTHYRSLPFSHQSMRRSPGTRSKCRSRLNTGRECWRQRAAIQTSLEGIGVPARLSSPRTAA
jgi:hypothetical protein